MYSVLGHLSFSKSQDVAQVELLYGDCDPSTRAFVPGKFVRASGVLGHRCYALAGSPFGEARGERCSF
jgi:hypothetical protein